MSLLDDHITRARSLVYELDNAERECFKAMGEMHEEMVTSSPRYSEYEKAQTALINAQKGNATPITISFLNDRFLEIDSEIIKASPQNDDYNKIIITYNKLHDAISAAMCAQNKLEELSSISKTWAFSNSEGTGKK